MRSTDWNGPDDAPMPPGYKGGSKDFTVSRISDPTYNGNVVPVHRDDDCGPMGDSTD